MRTHLSAITHTRALLAFAAAASCAAIGAPAAGQGDPLGSAVLYRANLHSHTGYSDGYWLFWPEGENPATAYSYARSHGLDALAVTDHGEMLNLTEWQASVNAALAAAASYWPFCAVHGFEWSGTDYVPDTGHVNVFGSRTRVGAYQTGQNTPADVFGTLGAFYGWLSQSATPIDSDRPGSPTVVAQFNHPTAHDGSDHHNQYLLPEDERLRETMALFEMGSWTQDPGNPFGIVYEGKAADNDTFDPRWSAEYWYRRALTEGWRVAPSNNGDNHLGDYVWHHRFGPPTCTGIYMTIPPAAGTGLQRQSALLDALRARRTFAAEDRDAEVVVTADAGASPQAWWMGSAFGTPPDSGVSLRVRASDPTDRISAVQLLCHAGSVVAGWTGLNASTFDQTVVLSDADLAALPLTNRGEVCIYAKVTEADGELLFAAPVWITRPNRASTMAALEVLGSVGTVTFAATLQRSGTAEMMVGRPVVFSVNGAPVGVVKTDASGCATLDTTVPTAQSYVVWAQFMGDADGGACYATRSLDAAKFTSLTTIDRTGVVTEATTLRGYLKRLSDNAWCVGKTVDFRIDGSYVGSSVTDSNGHAGLPWAITPGPATRAIVAEFAGDEDLQSSRGTATLMAIVWNTKMVSFNRTARITDRTEMKCRLLRSDNAPLYGRAINFCIDGTFIITRTTNVDGYASYPNYDVPDGAGAGSRTILSEWPGNGGYAAISKTATLTVLKAIPYIWVLSKSVPQGGTANLYAYFRRLYDYQKQVGKTVDFKIDGTVIQTVITDDVGVARHLYRTVETPGVHTVRCEFHGDAWVESGYGEGSLTIY